MHRAVEKLAMLSAYNRRDYGVAAKRLLSLVFVAMTQSPCYALLRLVLIE